MAKLESCEFVLKTPIFKMIWRGFLKKCPHCGEGELFQNGSQLHEHCPVCGRLILRDQGDLWGILLVLDRALFIFPMVVITFLRWYHFYPRLYYAGIAFLAVVFLWLHKQRLGCCVALYHVLNRDADPSEV